MLLGNERCYSIRPNFVSSDSLHARKLTRLKVCEVTHSGLGREIVDREPSETTDF